MSTKTKNKKIFTTRVLMIVSQILLTGFVLFWLIEEYKKEENSLRKELTFQFINSQNKAYDRLLKTYIVNPILMETQHINFQKKEQIITLPHKKNPKSKKREALKIEYNYSNKNGVIKESKDSNIVSLGDEPNLTIFNDDSSKMNLKFNIKGNSKNSDSLHNEIQIVEELHNEILVRSVKLIVENSKNELANQKMAFFEFKQKQDTTILKNEFENTLKSKGFFFSYDWIYPDNLFNLNSYIPGIFIKSQFPNLPSVIVYNYRTIIFKQLSPQLLFSVLLLGLFAFAFHFSFQNMKRQYQLNALKNDFISNITHELKTPVSTILLALENIDIPSIKDKNLQARNYLRIMSDETKRLNNLIVKVISQSKLENKSDLLKKEQTNLTELIFEVLKSAKLIIEKNNISVKTDKIEADIWGEIDKTYIFGVIFNLVDNAIKYSEQNTEIEISLSRKNKEILLSVADSGQGIPEEYLPKLFDKFFRVPQNNTHNVKGYGLGLSYAKLVMNEHNGSITAENRTEGGSRFTLKFPISN